MKNNVSWILMNPQTGARNRRRGLTLVELLVVISIIAVLCMLTVTMVSKTRQSSRATRCLMNLRQIYVAAQIYSQDHNNQVLPGESWNGSTHLFWHWILRPDLNGYGVWEDQWDGPLRCMESKAGTQNYWAWGYGANSRPGMEGPSTSGMQGSFNAEQVGVSNPTTWQRTFRQEEITHPHRRLFICDSHEWQAAASDSGESAFPDYDRHGKGKCNVLFFDGHVAALGKMEVKKALYNPGG